MRRRFTGIECDCVNTNFAISRANEHMNKSLIIYTKLGGIRLLPGSRTISITAMVGLIFCDEHKIYNKNQGRVTIDKYCMPILQEIPLYCELGLCSTS